jgi:hypothetical protein
VKTILALDLGTKTGWAYRNGGGIISAGCWVLQKPDETTAAAKLRRDRTLDMRIPTLYRLLKDFWQFSRFTGQTQLWASLRAVVWQFCFNYGIARDCCPVGTLKKHCTGCGTAMKSAMIEGAQRLYPGIDIGFDDNKADALCLLNWAIKLTSRK